MRFLPIDSRREIWADWYKDARKSVGNYLDEHFRGLQRTTRVVYHTDDPITEFFGKLIVHAGTATNPNDFINRCPDDNCIDPNAGPAEQRADRAMRRIAGIRGLQVHVLPDVTFVHGVTGDDVEDLASTIICQLFLVMPKKLTVIGINCLLVLPGDRPLMNPFHF